MKTNFKWRGYLLAVCAILLVGCTERALIRAASEVRHTTETPKPPLSESTEHITPPPDKNRTVMVGAAASTVEYHVWQPLNQTPEVVWRGARYKMYTYVLFNGPVQGKLRFDEQKALLRLTSLLEIVGRREDLASAPENQVRSQQDTNVFLIPSLAANLSEASLKAYDIGISRNYLNYFSKALATNQPLHKRLRKSGPFLLSTLKPIGEILQVKPDGTVQVDTRQPILLVDMSNAHEKSVAEVVRTFKNHVADTPMSGTAAFEPLRLKLISTLLKLNDAIPLVSNAVAGSCGMVGAEALCK